MVGQGALVHAVDRPVLRLDGCADHRSRPADLPHRPPCRHETVSTERDEPCEESILNPTFVVWSPTPAKGIYAGAMLKQRTPFKGNASTIIAESKGKSKSSCDEAPSSSNRLGRLVVNASSPI